MQQSFTRFQTDPYPPVIRSRNTALFAWLSLFLVIMLGYGESYGQTAVSLGAPNTPVVVNFDDLPQGIQLPGTSPYMLSGVPLGPLRDIVARNTVDHTNFSHYLQSGVYRYASNGGSSNFSFGARADGTNPVVYYGVTFRNNTGQTIKCVRIRFKAQQWSMRDNLGRLERHNFGWMMSGGSPPPDLLGGGWIPNLDLDVTGDNGNDACGGTNFTQLDGQQPININNRETVLAHPGIPPGQFITLRWQIVDLPDNCYQPSLAIDDLELTPYPDAPQLVPPPVLFAGGFPCSGATVSWSAPAGFQASMITGYRVVIDTTSTFGTGMYRDFTVPAAQTSAWFDLHKNMLTVQARVMVLTQGCGNTFFNPASNILSNFIAATPISVTANPASEFCNSGFVNLTVSPPNTPLTVTWEKAEVANGPCLPNLVYQPTGLSGNNVNGSVNTPTCFRAKITYINSPTNCERFSAPIFINIHKARGGTIPPPNTAEFCGSGIVSLMLNDQYGTIVWEKQRGCVGAFNATTETSTIYNFSPLTETYCYRAKVTSFTSPSCFQYSNIQSIGVNPNPVVGTASPQKTTQCAGDDNRVSVNFFGGDMQWEEQPNCSGLFTPIIGANGFEYGINNLTATTCYRAVVMRQGCPNPAVSNVARIDVTAGVVPFSLRGPASVCGNGIDTFRVNLPQNGVTYTWAITAPGINIVSGQGTNQIVVRFDNVQSGSYTILTTGSISGCPNTESSGLNFTVVGATQPGTLNPPVSNTCFNSPTPVVLTVSGQQGSIIRWEASRDNFNTRTNITVTTNTLSVQNLTQNTQYRAIVQSGTCLDLPTRPAVVEVSPQSANPGTLSANVTDVCGSFNSILLSLTNFTGQIIRWERSNDNFVANITSVVNNNSFLNVNNLTETTYFRAIVGNIGCNNERSNVVIINHAPQTVAGVLTGPTSVCGGSNSGVITLNNHVGNVVQWESSTDNFASATVITNPNTSLSFSNLANTIRYRALIQSGTCTPLYTPPFLITVNSQINAGRVVGETQVCALTGSGSLVLQGHSGSVIRWESSTDNGLNWTTIANTTVSQTFSGLEATTTYRAIVSNAGCGGEAASLSATVTVIGSAEAGNVSATASVVCPNNSTTITLSGNTAPIQRWERSARNCNGPWTMIFSNQSSINTGFLQENTCFRAVVANPNCNSVLSNAVMVEVRAFARDSIRVVPITCRGANNGIIRLFFSGSNNFEYSINNGQSFQASNEFSNLAPGTYIVVVRDANNTACVSTPELVTMNQPFSSFDITDAVIRNADCRNINNPTGSINITVQGGIQPYQFTWSNGVNTEDLVDVAPGSYTVTIVDNNGQGCSRTQAYQVGGASVFTVTGNVSNVTCAGNNNGSITLNIVGGSNPFTFLWNDGITTGNRSNLAAGNYTVSITDDLGCTQSRSFTVTSGSSAIALTFTSQDVPCQNSGTGSVSVSVAGGQPPYTYLWSNNQTTSQLFGLNAGTYTVTVGDANGCTKTGSRTINAFSGPTAPTASPASEEVCVGTAVRLTAVSNEVGVQFQWFESQEAIFAFNVGSVIEVTPNTLGRKTYYVQAVFNNRPQCPSSRVPVSFNVVSGAQAGTLSGSNSVCVGQTVQITLTPATQTVIRWESSTNGGNTWTPINNTTPTLNTDALTQTTSYRAVVRSGSCPDATTNPFTVTVAPSFSAGVAMVTGQNSFCSGEPNSATILLSQNSPNSTVVRWESSVDGGNTWTNIANETVSLAVSNVLRTTAYRAVVRNGNCPSLNSQSTIITVRNCGGIAVTEQSLAFGTVRVGCESLNRTYNVTGENLTEDIFLTAPANIEIASDFDGPFGSTLRLTNNGGSLSATVYVRVSNSAPQGLINGSIVHASTGQNPVSVNVTANVQTGGTPQFNSATTVLTFGEVIINNVSQPKMYVLEATNLSGNSLNVSVNRPYGVSLDPAGPFSTSLAIPVQGCSINEEIYVQFAPEVVGQATQLILHTNNGGQFTIQASGFGILDPNGQQPDVVLDDEWDDQNEVDDEFGPGRFDFGVNAFSDLQMAVDRTGDGKTLYVAAHDVDGSNVVVDNPMTISGQGDTRTFIEPKGDMTNNYEGDDVEDALNGGFSARHGLIIKSDDVTIKNLTIDGGANNPCDKKFGVGILTDTRTGDEYDDIDVENVDIRNVYSRGIQISGRGHEHDIKNVEIVNVCQRLDPDPKVAGEAAGIYSDDPIELEDVVIRDAGSGVIIRNLTGNFAQEITRIERTRIENVVEDGIQLDLRSTPNENILIQGNTINGVGDVGIEARGLAQNTVIGGTNDSQRNRITINSRRNNDPGTGIRVTYSDGTVIQNNEVNAQGKETAIELFQNVDPNRPVIVRNNNLNHTGGFASNPDLNEAVGVFMSDNGQYINAPNAPTYARMEGNTIDGYNIGVFTNGNGVIGNVFVEIAPNANGVSNTIKNAKEGIRVNGYSRARVMRNSRSIENSDIGIYVYGGDLYMEGNAVHNNRIGVLVEDKPGYVGTATIYDNQFYSNGQNVVNNSNDQNNFVNASWNWWGSTNPVDVRAKLAGRIDYSPFFNDSRDLDNNLNNGWTGVRDVVHVDVLSPKTAPAGPIQEAVNDTRVMKINVVDGIYDETTTINRSIALTNDGVGMNPILMNLTMANPSATLTLDQNFDLTGQLNLNGGKIVLVNDKVLTILRGGNTTAGSDNSYVIGRLARQSASTNNVDLYYPIGGATAFRPATLSVGQTSTALNTYTGRVIEPNNVNRQLPAGVTSVSTSRVHNFTNSGGAGISSANIRIAYGAGDPTPNNQNSLTILKDQDGAGSVWTDAGGTIVAAGLANLTPFNNLGNFALALKPIDNNGGGNNGGGNNGGGNNGGGGTVTASEITNINNISATSALIIWSMPNCTGARYEFRYKMSGTPTWTTVMNLTTTSYFLTGLQPGTRYDVSVRSMCTGQMFSDWSTTVLNNFSTLPSGSCDGVTPPVPGGMLVSNVRSRTATLSWNLVTNGEGQGTIISFGPVNQSPSIWTQVIVCHPTTSYFFTNLQPNTIYGVRIRTNCSNCTTALNTNDRRSAWSSVMAFSTTSTREDLSDNSAVQNLSLYPNPNQGTFNVSFVSEKAEQVAVRIMDMKGVIVFERELQANEGTNELPIELNGFAEGIYNLMILKGGQVTNAKLHLK